MVTIAQQQFKEVGVQVEIQLEEWNAFLDRLTKSRDFDMVVVGWALGVDSGTQKSIWHSSEIKAGFNFVSFVNPEVDKIMEENVKVPGCDKAKRLEMLYKWQQILADEQPYDFLFIGKTLLVANNKLKGVEPSPFAGVYWNIEKWYSATGK